MFDTIRHTLATARLESAPSRRLAIFIGGPLRRICIALEKSTHRCPPEDRRGGIRYTKTSSTVNSFCCNTTFSVSSVGSVMVTTKRFVERERSFSNPRCCLFVTVFGVDSADNTHAAQQLVRVLCARRYGEYGEKPNLFEVPPEKTHGIDSSCLPTKLCQVYPP